jgi:glutamine amidotransferase
MIVIVDSGGANLVSIKSAVSRLNYEALISSSVQDIEQASHIILPGVGSAKTVMQRLNRLGLIDALKTTIKPVLEICVGMQVLYEFSEEGDTTCLGILQGVVKKLVVTEELCLPHMGWNTIQKVAESNLMRDVLPQSYQYFVHSFFAPISSYTITKTQYGSTFSSAVHHCNFTGVQFHPERSGTVGSQLIKNFLEPRA